MLLRGMRRTFVFARCCEGMWSNKEPTAAPVSLLEVSGKWWIDPLIAWAKSMAVRSETEHP